MGFTKNLLQAISHSQHKWQTTRTGSNPCKIFTEISPWCLLNSKSRRDCGEVSSISLRLPRTRWDCRDCAEIVEISPWRLWHSKSRWDRREISSISPRLPRSHRDLTMMFEKPTNIMERSQRSRHDICWFLKSRRVHGEIFYISPRLARTRHEIRLFLYLAKILKDTNFLPRLPKYNPIIPRWNE